MFGLVAYRIGLHSASLPQNTHGSVEIWLKGRSDGESNVAETGQDGDLNVAVEDFTLKIFKQQAHERGSVLGTLLSKGPRNVPDDADRHGAQLGVFV